MTFDHSQFEAIYHQHKQLVFNLALQYVQNTEDAEDITQEVFVKISPNMYRFQQQNATIKTWIHRICINHSLDYIKKKKTQKRFGFITSLFHKDTQEPIAELINHHHPGIALEDKEQLRNLFMIINSLPDTQKTAIILSKIEDYSQREAAVIMNVSEKAFESLLQRAKQNIAKKLTLQRK